MDPRKILAYLPSFLVNSKPPEVPKSSEPAKPSFPPFYNLPIAIIKYNILSALYLDEQAMMARVNKKWNNIIKDGRRYKLPQADIAIPLSESMQASAPVVPFHENEVDKNYVDDFIKARQSEHDKKQDLDIELQNLAIQLMMRNRNTEFSRCVSILNRCEKIEWSCLKAAVQYNFLIIVELILKKNEISKIDLNLQDNNGKSLLFFATDLNILKALVNAGADLRVTDSKRHTLLMNFVDPRGIWRVNAFEFLLENSAKSINYRDKNNDTALTHTFMCLLTFYFKTTTPIKLLDGLLKYNQDVNFENRDGYTPLNFALSYFAKIMNFFLPRANNIEHARNTLIKLIEMGADPNYKLRDEKLAGLSERVSDKYFSANKMHSSSWESFTALMAMSYGLFDKQVEILQKLLDMKPHVDVVNEFQKTALSYACEQSESAAKLLLEHKANPNHLDNNGNTPLHIALLFSQSPSLNFVSMLLEYKADPTIENNQGKNALKLFSAKNLVSEQREDIVQLLSRTMDERNKSRSWYSRIPAF